MRPEPAQREAAPTPDEQIDAIWDTPPRASRPSVTRYEIRTAGGALVAIHERLETPDGKRMYWTQPDGSMGLGGIPLADLPLYGAERASSWDATRPVIVTEGEKAAAALVDAGWQAVGTVTGASSTPGLEALRVLTGCEVVLWPDSDRIGAEHMARVADRLSGIASSVHTIAWEAAPEHGDAADYLAASMVDVTIDELISDARIGIDTGPVEVLKPGGTGMDAADLLALELPPLRWVVPDMLPEGTSILAAPPKIGKSCLVYQVAVEASVGGELFGRRVEPGSVLYLALEDGQRRGQDRLRAALAGRTMPRGRLEVRWSAPKIGQGLEEELTAWLDAHPDAILVAIDTLGKVRARSDGRRNAYEVDVEDLGRLQSIFRDRTVALVIVHHAAKAKQDDFLASVSGTYGITGSADTTLVIKRSRQDHFGSITVTGRDVPDHTESVRFDDMLWHSAPQSLAAASFERTEVYEVIRQHGPIWPKAIGDQIGKTRQAAAYLVDQLVSEGVVARGSRGYALVAPEPDVPARARVDIPPSSAVRDEQGEQGETPARARARSHDDEADPWWMDR